MNSKKNSCRGNYMKKYGNFDWLNPVTSKKLYSIQKLQTDLSSVETVRHKARDRVLD